ncbi:MAG: hypothetical protein ABI835_02800 [Chloroflexota bacterium]
MSGCLRNFTLGFFVVGLTLLAAFSSISGAPFFGIVLFIVALNVAHQIG